MYEHIHYKFSINVNSERYSTKPQVIKHIFLQKDLEAHVGDLMALLDAQLLKLGASDGYLGEPCVSDA
jgi:hypothetical protein